ncbi:MAG: dicarboxylate/amino acid:cation symporter [Verrucomicrobia bacterium]|nr:dicarboxylate/amino acid:cation symporter [Verrucomicrobiota bacterium]
MKLWLKILIGVAVGLILGTILGPRAEYLEPVGTLFLNLIRMLVVLLVFSSMTVGITSIHDPKKLTRVGLKSFAMFMITTVIAIGIGLGLAYLIKPGVGAQLGQVTEVINIQPAPSVVKLLLGVIPNNPIQAFAEGNILQVIVFSIFLGLALNLCGEKGKPLLKMIEALAETMYRLTNIVMEFAPYGVAAIMAYVAGRFGFETLLSLLKFLLINYLGCAIQLGVVYTLILVFLVKVKPLPFFKGMGDAIMLALSTNSSSATLPVTLHCAEENLGISRNIASFVLPLGSTINMNGAAIFQGIAAVYMAQAYGIDLAWQQLLVIVVTAVLSAIGAAGIPGTGFIMLAVVLQSVGLPMQGIATLFAVDRLREMFSTVVNVLGDVITALWVANGEGELNMDTYNSTDLIGYEETEI